MSDDEDEEGDDDIREAHEKDMIADEIFMGTGADEGEALDVPLHPGEDEEEDDEESGMKHFSFFIYKQSSCFELATRKYLSHSVFFFFSSDIDDFIVDDDGQPLKKPKWRKKLPGYTDA